MKICNIFLLQLLAFVAVFGNADSCDLSVIPNYFIYENAGVDHSVEYGKGNTDNVASMTLDTVLQKYFRLSSTYDLITISNITRDETTISGSITCTPVVGPPHTVYRSFTVRRYNDIEDIVFDDSTHSFEENFVNIDDRSEDFTWEATDPDKVDGSITITYEIINQFPFPIFDLRSQDAGNFFVNKTVDYENNTQFTMVVQAKSEGLTSDGGVITQTATATLIADVINLDDNEPQLEGCLPVPNACVDPVYKGYVPPGSPSGYNIVITPAIKITDVDDLPDVTETYELYNTDSSESDEFQIDSTTGDVSLKKDILAAEKGTHYELVVVAIQDETTFYTYLDIVVNVEDTVPPTTTLSSTTGYISSKDTPGVVVDGSGKRITVSTSDADEIDAKFAYEVSPTGFQVINELLYYFPTGASSKASETVSITVINLNPEASSEFRKSTTIITVDTTSARECEKNTTFKMTTKPASFGDARAECFEFGGDLLQNNLGPEGSKYHSEIYQLINPYIDDGVWMGYTDLGHEGTWRFLNGELYDANNRGQHALAYWSSGQPDNLGCGGKVQVQDCAQLWRPYSSLELDDGCCEFPLYAVCEIIHKC